MSWRKEDRYGALVQRQAKDKWTKTDKESGQHNVILREGKNSIRHNYKSEHLKICLFTGILKRVLRNEEGKNPLLSKLVIFNIKVLWGKFL